LNKTLGFLLLGVLSGSLLAAPKNEAFKKGDLMLRARPSGAVTVYFKKKPLFDYYLGVHWIRNQTKSTDQVMRRDGDRVRYQGTLNNIGFINTTELTADGMKTVYELNLKQDNDFAVGRNWEITPALSMKTLEAMRNCTYSYDSTQGTQSGKLKELISFQGAVKRFTIHGYQGRDLVMLFPSGAQGMDRRKEKRPEGLWFFYKAVDETGRAPKVAGETGKIDFQLKVVQSGAPEAALQAKPAAKEAMNALFNGSFEEEANPGYPDGWGPFFWDWPGRGEMSSLMDLKSFMAIDKEQAFEGRQSLRIIVPERMKEINIQHTFIRTMPNNRDAVFSIYMKSFRDRGAKVTLKIRPLSGEPWAQKTFSLTEDWKRYEVKFKTPKKGRFQPWITAQEGIFWVDAAKLELGTEATPFVSASQQAKPGATAQTGTRKSHAIPVLPQPPPMDGNFTHDFWKKALEFPIFYLVQSQQPLTQNKTNAKMAISGTTLYLAFECLGKNRAALQKNHDDMVWTDDSVEFFLDPGSPPVMDAADSRGSYYHFAVNSQGVFFDIYKGGETRPFDGQIKTFCRRFEDKWIAQIAIDLTSLNINKLERNWRFNLCREDHTNNQYSSSFPLKRLFHSYNEFGYGTIPEELHRKLTNLCVKNIQLQADGGAVLQLDCQTAPGKVAAELQVFERNQLVFSGKWTGKAKAGSTRCEFSGKEIAGEDLLAIVKMDGADGSRLYDKIKIVNDKIAMFRRNYYTTEKQAELIWRNLPALSRRGKLNFGSHKAPYKLRDGHILVDIATIPAGDYQVSVEGKPVPFVKLVPHPNEVKIDQDKNSLIVAGKPFSFYGSYAYVNHKSKFLLQTYGLPEMKKAGFNGIAIHLREGYNAGDTWSATHKLWDLDWYISLMDSCHKYGLKVIIFMPMSHSRGANYKTVFSPETVVPKIKNHPALLAWYIADEPVPEHNEEIWKRYRYVRDNDPYHPVIVNVTTMGLAIDVTADKKTGKHPFDIYSLTYYPVGCVMNEDTEIGLKTGPQTFKQLFAASKKDKGVLIHAAQAYGYGTDHWTREPTPAEISYLIYMPLVLGNRGWSWFGGRTKCLETWQAIVDYGREVQTLTPILANSDKVNDDELLHSTCGNVFGILRQLGDAYYLITVNKTPQALKTRFDLREWLPAKFKKAEVLFENRQVKMGQPETYGPYQRHVYKITR
jgi:hypothetical protein